MAAAVPAKGKPLNLPLHFAVWDNDLDALQALLTGEGVELEALDPKGYTPLLLAFAMGRTQAARMLLAAGAFPKARTPEGWEALHVAALTANPDLVRSAVLAYLEESDRAFSRRLPQLQAALAALPDFELRMQWEFTSWVPLVSRLLPSDTYYIYKRGSSVRLDTSLLGMTGMKWERGSISLLLWGADMPRPGAMYVLDNEEKTAADARLSFTHPPDQNVIDWVRKLLTARFRTTDFWSRDVVMRPVMKKGLIGGLTGRLSKLAFGDSSTPRGRISDPREGGAAAAASAEDDGSTEPPPFVDSPDVTKKTVGLYEDCPVYELKNLCVRDVIHNPILHELKLESWWKPEYSRQATDADVAASVAASRGGSEATASEAVSAARDATLRGSAAAAAPAGGSSGGSGGGKAKPALPTDEAPEKKLGPLFAALRAIRSGKINEHNASSATVEQLEGMGFFDAAHRPIAGHTQLTMTFQDHFGFVDTTKKHAPKGTLAVFKLDDLTTENKILDCQVFFSKDFPITTADFLPVAELMARTSSHAENLRRFFQSKFPAGAGFPVKFSLPVFPTVTATVTFEFCDTRRSPPASLFALPEDYKMGAYVERGWIRQI